MQELTAGWKLFRALSIFQFILVCLLLVLALVSLFTAGAPAWRWYSLFFYSVMFLFLLTGQQLLNDHYPDLPLNRRQKRKFNWLFLLNVLLIPFLSGRVISEWRQVSEILLQYNIRLLRYLILDPMPAVHGMVLILHLFFLAGMFQLRSLIARRAGQQLREPFES